MATLKTWAIQGENTHAHIGRTLSTALIAAGGVVDKAARSFQVTENTGADMAVKVGSGTLGDLCAIAGDAAGQGVYIAEHQNATETVTIGASDPTRDRIDLIVARVYDDEADSSGQNKTEIEVVEGEPKSSNPTAPAVPAGAIALAEVAVDRGVTGITDADITDRRTEIIVAGQHVETLVFESSDTFTKADYPWLKRVRVIAQGGGGAGGGAAATGANQCSAGNGGGAGAYAEKTIDVADLAATETITVGTGGAGVSGATGGDGGTSSFGSHCSAGGGIGAGVVSASGTVNHGASSSNTQSATGDLVVKGGTGGGAMRYANNRALPGRGGDAVLGKGGGHASSGNDGEPGGEYGGGGGGASTTSSASAQTGGGGGDGVVIVELFA